MSIPIVEDNLAIAASRAIASGRRPASAYHRLARGATKMRTCAGECVNRICQDCKVECNECSKDICPHCAYWQESAESAMYCFGCALHSGKPGTWKTHASLPESCFPPHHQHIATQAIQTNPTKRCLSFDGL